MHESGPRSPARLLAPLALVAFALAVALVVLSSSVGDDGDGGTDPSADRAGTSAQTTTTDADHHHAATRDLHRQDR